MLAAPCEMLDILTSLFLLEFPVEDPTEEITFGELGGRIQQN